MEEKPRSPIERLTFVGRLLLLGTLVLFGGAFYFYYMYLVEHLPSGHYFLVRFWLPVVVACPIFFFLAAWILGRCGIRIYKK